MQIRTAQEMQAFAAEFAMNLRRRTEGATLVTLSGELGAGKTTFAQAFGKALGVEEDVTSPTFVIEKIYPLKGQQFERFIHIDAYRLEEESELQVLGFDELLRDPKDVVVLEWPEKVAGLIPRDAITMRFDIHGDERTISINGKESSEEKGVL